MPQLVDRDYLVSNALLASLPSWTPASTTHQPRVITWVKAWYFEVLIHILPTVATQMVENRMNESLRLVSSA